MPAEHIVMDGLNLEGKAFLPVGKKVLFFLYRNCKFLLKQGYSALHIATA